MRLTSMKVIGFQSFKDSGNVVFNNGLNIIVGQNNVGKSAFVRALELPLDDNRHRDAKTFANHALRVPFTILDFVVSGAEIKDTMLKIGGQWNISVRPFPPGFNFETDLLEKEEVHFKVKSSIEERFISMKRPSFSDEDYSHSKMQVVHAVGGEIQELSGISSSGREDNIVDIVWYLAKNKLFVFKPERNTTGDSEVGYADTLLPDAVNLAQVLLYLQGHRVSVFTRLVNHLREIFPTVGNLSVRLTPVQRLEVQICPTDIQERPELSFPLSRSGTGVAQVTAILTAIMTVDDAIIVIDEINSFLHSSAVKALLRIIQTYYSQHQYIISTHASEVISYGAPDTIWLVTRDGYESSIRAVDLKKLEGFRVVAEQLGVTLTDVFAADHIIWVEGQTEYLCFPYIYTYPDRRLPRGTVISKVVNTGDFFAKGQDPKLLYNIYQQLASASQFVLTSATFSFDPDGKNQQKLDDIVKASAGRVKFLPRRNFECYLVHPAAIAAFINSQSRMSMTKENEVREHIIAAARSGSPYSSKWTGDISDVDWLSYVDAPRLINEVCNEISNACVVLNKAEHSLFLLKYIMENDRLFITDLITYVEHIVEGDV